MSGTIYSQLNDAAETCTISLPIEFTHKHRADFLDSFQSHGDAVRKWIVDFTRVEFIDSSALGLLLILKEHEKKSGQSIVLMALQEKVLDALRMANFQSIFKIE